MALRAIYKRFFLASQEVYIQMHEEIEEYFLMDMYTVTSGTAPVKYITDTAENPFDETTLLKIEQCWDEGGNLLYLDDFTQELSLHTPSYRSIQVPWPNDFNSVAVQYRSSHPKIVYSAAMDPATVDVACPEPLYEAMMLYVGYRAVAALHGDDGTEGNSFWQRYNASCKEVEDLGLFIQGEPGDWRFDDKGWV
jgi:hypothetical protein